jgi:hypothetical protein
MACASVASNLSPCWLILDPTAWVSRTVSIVPAGKALGAVLAAASLLRAMASPLGTGRKPVAAAGFCAACAAGAGGAGWLAGT